MKQIEITKYLNQHYPEHLAGGFDLGKISLQFGSNNKDIKRVLIALDGTTAVVDEAIEKDCDLLITHHPFMFNSVLSVDYDSPFGKKLIKVFNHKLNIFAMHTNFDTAIDGMNDILSRTIGLQNVYYIKEELDNSCVMRIGTIEPIKLIDFVALVTDKLGQEGARYVGDPNKLITKVGIVGGAGSSEIRNAVLEGCDCYITGEIQHHHGLDATDNNIALIEVNHAVEALFKQPLKDKLEKAFPEIEFIIANEQDPFRRYTKK